MASSSELSLASDRGITNYDFLLWRHGVVFFVFSHFPDLYSRFLRSDAPSDWAEIVRDLTVLGVASWLIGREVWTDIRRSVRLPRLEGFALAIAIPTGMAVVIALSQYIIDSFRAAINTEVFHSLNVASYLTFPGAYLFSPPGVEFFEEVTFRGVLQPRFVRRYGVVRGICLVGIVFVNDHLNPSFFGPDR
jgi:membrane protease YdiL (CAAX protease family)